MCENRNNCGVYARMLHATTGFCPYGSDVSDATQLDKNIAINANVLKSPVIETKASKYNHFGTGKPKKKWTNSHKDQLKIE